MSFFQAIHDWAAQYPVLFATICSGFTALAGAVWSAFVSSLPAPTAQSTAKYQFWFKFFNTLAANFARAKSTAVENSPNFAAAVNAQNAKTGTETRVVEMSSPAETKP